MPAVRMMSVWAIAERADPRRPCSVMSERFAGEEAFVEPAEDDHGEPQTMAG
jgi:hypothetical protein